MGKGSWHEIGAGAVCVYTLAYLGDRGLVWELGTCLLLQQPWLDCTKLMGLHVSICSMRMVKTRESVSEVLGQCKVKHPSGWSSRHEKINRKVPNVTCADSLLPLSLPSFCLRVQPLGPYSSASTLTSYVAFSKLFNRSKTLSSPAKRNKQNYWPSKLTL